MQCIDIWTSYLYTVFLSCRRKIPPDAHHAPCHSTDNPPRPQNASRHCHHRPSPHERSAHLAIPPLLFQSVSRILFLCLIFRRVKEFRKCLLECPTHRPILGPAYRVSILSRMALVNSWVEDSPPMSRVRTLPSAMTA